MWTRSKFNKDYLPGYFALLIDSYRNKRHASMANQIMTTKTSKKAREQNYTRSGLTTPTIKGEGAPIPTWDTQIQGATQTWTPDVWCMAVRITEEAIDDNLMELTAGGDNLKELFHDLSEAMSENEEILGARFLVNGAATTYHSTRNSKALFSTTHPRLGGGTWSNYLTNADLTYTSFWSAVTSAENQLGDRGQRIQKKVKALWIPPELERQATEILKSTDRPDTANRATNAMAKSGRNIKLKKWSHLTDTDAWYLQLDGEGIIRFNNRKTRFAREKDFETGDIMVKADQRFSIEINDERAWFGNVPA